MKDSPERTPDFKPLTRLDDFLGTQLIPNQGCPHQEAEGKRELYHSTLRPAIAEVLEAYFKSDPVPNIEPYLDDNEIAMEIFRAFATFYETYFSDENQALLSKNASSIPSGFATGVKTIISLARIYKNYNYDLNDSFVLQKISQYTKQIARLEISTLIGLRELFRESDESSLWDSHNFRLNDAGEVTFNPPLAPKDLKDTTYPSRPRVGCPVLFLQGTTEKLVTYVLREYDAAIKQTKKQDADFDTWVL